MAPDPDLAELRVASRTDRGVHALGNALTVRSALSGPSVLRALNGLSPQIFFTHATPVDERFSPRRAVARSYRYFERPHPGGLEPFRAVAQRLVGEVDVRTFGRGAPAERPSFRRVDRLEVAEGPRGWTIDVVGTAFAWGMVRKLVAALREVADGRRSAAEVVDAARGRKRLTLPMAEPGGLVLWSVDYGVPWTFALPGLTRAQRRWLSSEGELALQRDAVVGALRAGLAQEVGAPPPG